MAVNIPHWKINLTKQEREELKSNPNIKVFLQIKTWGLLYCLQIGFKLRHLNICMTSCHIVKSCNRTGMKAVLTKRKAFTYL